MSTIRNLRPFVCRFAAGENAHALAAVWRVWTGRNKPEAYVAVRSVGQVKATVHCPFGDRQTWKRHFGFDYNARGAVADAVRADGGSRHKASWRGAAIGLGRTIEWRIFVLNTELRKVPLPVSDDVMLVSPPPEDRCLIFAVALGPADGPPDFPKAQDADTHLLAEGRLCDGRFLWITYCYAPQIKILPHPNRNPRIFGDRERMKAEGDLRASAVADNSDGSLAILDLRGESVTGALD